jgi:hypothetical protein
MTGKKIRATVTVHMHVYVYVCLTSVVLEHS